jgi:hypothetical protein
MYDACFMHQTSSSLMRVTAEIDPATYEHVKQRARLSNRAVGSVLGELITKGLKADPVRTVQSGRFTVIAAPEAACEVSAAQIQQLIDADGYL